jgi:hypothetical protein
MPAARHNGVSETIYPDRFLPTPLNFRLLHEVLTAIPGGTTNMKLEILTAQLDRPEQAGYLSFHSFSEDRQRQDILREGQGPSYRPVREMGLVVRKNLPHDWKE